MFMMQQAIKQGNANTRPRTCPSARPLRDPCILLSAMFARPRDTLWGRAQRLGPEHEWGGETWESAEASGPESLLGSDLGWGGNNHQAGPAHGMLRFRISTWKSKSVTAGYGLDHMAHTLSSDPGMDAWPLCSLYANRVCLTLLLIPCRPGPVIASCLVPAAGRQLAKRPNGCDGSSHASRLSRPTRGWMGRERSHDTLTPSKQLAYTGSRLYSQLAFALRCSSLTPNPGDHAQDQGDHAPEGAKAECEGVALPSKEAFVCLSRRCGQARSGRHGSGDVGGGRERPLDYSVKPIENADCTPGDGYRAGWCGSAANTPDCVGIVYAPCASAELPGTQLEGC